MFVLEGRMLLGGAAIVAVPRRLKRSSDGERTCKTTIRTTSRVMITRGCCTNYRGSHRKERATSTRPEALNPLHRSWQGPRHDDRSEHLLPFSGSLTSVITGLVGIASGDVIARRRSAGAFGLGLFRGIDDLPLSRDTGVAIPWDKRWEFVTKHGRLAMCLLMIKKFHSRRWRRIETH